MADCDNRSERWPLRVREWIAASGFDPDNLKPELAEKIQAWLVKALESGGITLADSIRTATPEALSIHRQDREGFERRIQERWAEALDLFDAILVTCIEEGDAFVAKYSAGAEAEGDVVFEALRRLFVCACRTMSEVAALLRTGHADGAMGRWRALHELSVISNFVSAAGPETARRYLEFEHVENFKAAQQYQDHCSTLQRERIDEEDLAALRCEYDRVRTEFGEAFVEEFGWARAALELTNPRARIHFVELERRIGLKHFRPYYRLASDKVHAGPRGTGRSLGTHYSGASLAGASNAGLSGAGHCGCLSLLQVTTVFFAHIPDLDYLLTASALGDLCRRAGEAFFAIEMKLRVDESRITPERP